MVHTHLVQTPSAYFLRSSTIPCLFLCLSLRSLLSDVAFLKYIEGCKHHLECGACERVGLKSVSWGFPRKNKSSPSLLPLPYVKGPRSWLLWWSRRKRSVEMHCTVCALTYGTECICSFHVRNTGLGDAKYSCCIRFHTKQIQGSFEQKKKIEFEYMISIVALNVEINDGFGLPQSPPVTPAWSRRFDTIIRFAAQVNTGGLIWKCEAQHASSSYIIVWEHAVAAAGHLPSWIIHRPNLSPVSERSLNDIHSFVVNSSPLPFLRMCERWGKLRGESEAWKEASLVQIISGSIKGLPRVMSG